MFARLGLGGEGSCCQAESPLGAWQSGVWVVQVYLAKGKVEIMITTDD